MRARGRHQPVLHGHALRPDFRETGGEDDGGLAAPRAQGAHGFDRAFAGDGDDRGIGRDG